MLGAYGYRLHLDLAAKRQLSGLADCASGSLSFSKEAGIELVDLLDIGQINESEIDIDDVRSRESRRFRDPEHKCKCALSFLTGRAGHINSVVADRELPANPTLIADHDRVADWGWRWRDAEYFDNVSL